ncbi:MAG: LysM peptidoglycan-binding domain-containing protein [Candidatus Eisenbacteria bacterium]|nr:LysM peptidoglycan-binding domain-containing protein [Candidatus Eisenbacteria bacterium]
MKRSRFGLTIGLPLLLGLALACTSRVPPPPPAAPAAKPDKATEQRLLLRRAEEIYRYGLDLYRSGRWEASARSFTQVIDLLDEKDSGFFGEAETQRSAALLRAKTVYYKDRCSRKQAAPVEPPPVETARAGTGSIPDADNSEVDRWIRYFTGRGKTSFARWLERSGRYEELMKAILIEENLPPDLFYLALIESGMNPNAYSRAHAVGPWQFIAGTARLYDLQADWWYDERRDPEYSCRAAARYLKDMYESLGDWYLTLAGFNYGEGRIQRLMRYHGTNDYWSLRRLPRETRDYVPKFLAARRIAKDPARYGFDVLPDPPIRYETLSIYETTSLDAVAQCACASLTEIEELNPAIRRSVTPPTRERVDIRVPEGAAERIRQCLLRIPVEERMTWEQYRVRRGDILSGIARRFDTSVDVLVSMNNLQSRHRIREGQTLLVPRLTRMRVAENAGPASGGDDALRRYAYVLRPGDTLSALAHRFGTSVETLGAWNDVSSPHRLRAGEKLVLFLPEKVASNFGLEADGGGMHTYTVRRGDTLHGIGKRFGVSGSQIADWNGIPLGGTIHPGDRLVIYGDGES